MPSILYEFTPDELQKLLNTSNGYSDLLRKVGLNPKGRNPDTLKKIIKQYNLDETQLNINRSNLYKECSNPHRAAIISLENILANNIEYQSCKLLKRLIDEGYKEYKCEICGITQWMEKKISLTLHHKDGNHLNNKLENLQILCPNCHSQTDNYAGRALRKNGEHKKKKVKKLKKELKSPPISRFDLKNKIRTQSFVSIGVECGVTDNAIRKWCIKYGLPSKVSVIKTYSDEEWGKI